MYVCSIKELNDFLSFCPLTTICHTKYGKLRQKCEYHHCQCGCSFQLCIHYSAEGTIPPYHFDVNENLDNRDKDKEVAKVIDALIV
jgi:hypothetical protein